MNRWIPAVRGVRAVCQLYADLEPARFEAILSSLATGRTGSAMADGARWLLPRWLLVAPPFRPPAELRGVERRLAEARKIGTPALVHRIGVLEILGIDGFHEGGIGAGGVVAVRRRR